MTKYKIDEFESKSSPRFDSITELSRKEILPDWQCFKDAEIIYTL